MRAMVSHDTVVYLLIWLARNRAERKAAVRVNMRGRLQRAYSVSVIA